MKMFCKIKINNYTYLFFLICALVGYLKNIIIIFSICLFHELGHIFFIKLFKYNIDCIELLPFGGYTQVNKKINSSINKDIIINLGGVFFQLILLLFLFLFKHRFNIITYNLIYQYNLILMFFNLIPVIPLDGNNIIHLLFEKIFSYELSYKLNFIVSLISILSFLFINYYFNIDNYFIFSFLIYKSLTYLKDYKYLKNRFLLERYLYDLEYKKIENNTKNLNELKKEVLHYFKENNKYIKEKNRIKNMLYSNSQNN